MDYSLSASTTSVLHTPTPAPRKPLYPDLSTTTPNRLSSSPSHSSALTRNVRFTDAQHQQRPNLNPYGSSSAPPTRVQSYSSSTVGGPISYSPPTSRLPIQRSPSSSSGGAIPGSIAPMSSSASAYASPVKRVAQVALQPVKRVEELVHKEVGQIRKHKMAVAPMGRGEAAKRLRVNAVLLVCWWLSSRTDVYKFIAGHLVQVVPSLDTPLHLLETLLAIILCWNIFDSMRCLNRFSSLAPTPTPTPTPASPRPSPASPSPSSPLQHPHSSPKTRPSPSPSPQTPTFRSSSLSSPTPPSPQTPSSLSRSASAVLRRSFAPGGASPSSSSVGGGSPLSRSVGGGAGAGGEEKGSPLHAFRARHSPVASKLSVNSKDAIDRLFDA